MNGVSVNGNSAPLNIQQIRLMIIFCEMSIQLIEIAQELAVWIKMGTFRDYLIPCGLILFVTKE